MVSSPLEQLQLSRMLKALYEAADGRLGLVMAGWVTIISSAAAVICPVSMTARNASTSVVTARPIVPDTHR